MIDASAKSRRRSAQHGNEVLGQHEPDDVVDRVLVDRVARAAALLDHRERLVERRVDRQRVDVRARRHDLARVLLRELEHALEQVASVRLEDAALLALLDENSQLVGRVDDLLERLTAFWPNSAQHELRRFVEQRR